MSLERLNILIREGTEDDMRNLDLTSDRWWVIAEGFPDRPSAWKWLQDHHGLYPTSQLFAITPDQRTVEWVDITFRLQWLHTNIRRTMSGKIVPVLVP
jgi:hypothetical protein